MSIEFTVDPDTNVMRRNAQWVLTPPKSQKLASFLNKSDTIFFFDRL